MILKTGVVRSSFLGTAEEEEERETVLCCKRGGQEIETGNHHLPSLEFWDTVEKHRKNREVEADCAL